MTSAIGHWPARKNLAKTMALCTLHHRLSHVTTYSPYATLLIAPNGELAFQPTHPQDLPSLHSDPLDRLTYHLALQCDDQPQSSWHLTSVKACHLPHATSQTLILHIDNSKPFAIDFFVSPIPQDASCPEPPSNPSLVESIRGLNTTIVLKSPHPPPLPELRNPQPPTPAGQPVQPLTHKSFIQKYWMYIALALIALVLTGGEDAGPRRQAQA
ncbi:hypothetical protein Ac2012v2_004088 [Leucoagaricus gongylophorus]